MDQPKGEQKTYDGFDLDGEKNHLLPHPISIYVEKPKGRPKLVKHMAQLISPQLLACKIETKTVDMPPALRQRNIQLQALESKRFVSEPLVAKVTSVENGLKHRKKTTLCDDPVQSNSDGYTTTSDEDSGPDESSIFETYLVVEFSPNIQRKTLHWIIDKIRRKTSHGGAGLLIRREPQNKYVQFFNFSSIILLIFFL